MSKQPTSSTIKITKAQTAALETLAEKPLAGYSSKKITARTFEALAKHEFAVRIFGMWRITQQGCDYLKIDKRSVDVRYAQINLSNGRQIRHNVLQVEEGSTYYRGEWRLINQYYPRSFDEEIEAVHDWQLRAIELARAEIRAGIAS